MCGIMGFYCFGSKRPDKDKITNLFSLLETRGKDASGYAFINDKNLFVNKAPVNSSKLIKTKEWLELELPKIMILHCRLKTQGTEQNNANNHPIFGKQGIALVHNGIIYNDKEIIGKNDRDAEVDSEAILALLALKTKGDKIKRLFEKIEGSFAVAIIDKSDPDRLILVKKDNPLNLYYNIEDDILYFCSDRGMMQEALGISKHSKRGFNLGEENFHFYEMNNNHALILNKEGVEQYQKYSPRMNHWFNYRMDDLYEVQCPWCYSNTRYDEGILHNRCQYCGMSLNEEDIYV